MHACKIFKIFMRNDTIIATSLVASLLLLFVGCGRDVAPLPQPAFAELTSSSTIISVSQCTAEERALWIGNELFTERFQSCSARGFGIPSRIAPCVQDYYPSISMICATCLGESSLCAAKNCFIPCIGNQGSPACRTCFAENCNAALLACTGAKDESELLPLPKNEPSKYGMGGEIEGATTTLPKRMRVRPTLVPAENAE